MFDSEHLDLITKDGALSKFELIDSNRALGEIAIQNIPDNFVGFDLPPEQVIFNIKSTLAQLGVNAIATEVALDRHRGLAEIKIELRAIGPLAREMLSLLGPGDYVGKLFAKDERRRVREPYYLERMFGRFDRDGKPLLSFGGAEKGESLVLKNVGGHMVAFLQLKKGRLEYDSSIFGFLPTLAMGLNRNYPMRDMLRFHQEWKKMAPKIVTPDRLLLVMTEPLHIRTVFARVVDELLPNGFLHTSASVLEPKTDASGDIYELFGESDEEIEELPLEFYTLEPHREHVYFSDRDQLKQLLEDPKNIFNTFNKAPDPKNLPCATFVMKGSQMERLKADDWVIADPILFTFPRDLDPSKQAELAQEYIKKQPAYPLLAAMEKGDITSQGVLFSRFLPSPLLKRLLISYYVQKLIHGIYFETPSRSGGEYFSPEDRTMLLDLTTYGIPVYWADHTSREVLQFVLRPGKNSGMFVPLERIDTFRKATFFGIYGSNLLAGNFEDELKHLLDGILKMRAEVDHPLLHKETPLALVTGGGPGAMEVGNRMAKELEILSCAHVVDFRPAPGFFVKEQEQNPYIEAKMTYRLTQLLERQAEFYLDFPIFVMGGIGTDFEQSLEELRLKFTYGNYAPTMLFGEVDYWKEKITSRFRLNVASGTIKGSEWVSNCFFVIQNHEQGLRVYRDFFNNVLPIGRDHPPALEYGFVVVD